MIDRRKFLEHSVLSAGSVLFSSVLLESCTKLGVSYPGGNTPPPLPGSTIDWNADIKTVVVFGIGLIPEVGEIIGPIVDKLWPVSGNSPWDQMKGDVEALMDQKMDADKYATVKGNLDGLQGVTTNYLNAIKNKGDIAGNWTDLRNDFSLYEPNFKQDSYEVLLLPLYAQFVNMYLNVLRDGSLHGNEIGLKQGDQDQALRDIDTLISKAGTYVDTWIPQGRQRLMDIGNQKKAIGTDWNQVEPFASVNDYNRQMTLNVLDYRNTWQYHSVTNYPDGKKGADGNPIKVTELLPREIYSDPYGCTYVGNTGVVHPKSNPIPLDSPLGGAPTSFPTQIAIWSGDRVDAVQISYPPNSGPNGVTQTPRMGGNGGNIDTIKYDLNNPITQFKVATNKSSAYPTYAIVMLLQFADSQGKPTKVYGTTNYPEDDWGWISYPDEAVSSVYVNGNIVSKWPSDANCVVVGFKYWDSPEAALRAVRLNYITSPREKSMDDLVKVFPGVAIPADLITYELKAARLAYWAWIKASAK